MVLPVEPAPRTAITHTEAAAKPLAGGTSIAPRFGDITLVSAFAAVFGARVDVSLPPYR